MGAGSTSPLAELAHRPYPLARGPWIMAQTWLDLCFAHWPVDPAALAGARATRGAPSTPSPPVPEGLELDTFDGAAWIGVVPFRMRGVRLRGLPPMPGLSAFPELNVRTYVVHDGRPGVFFWSLDAANRVAVRVARRWFRLPYYDARMRCRREGDGIDYESERVHRGAPAARFAARYRPTGPVLRARPGTLDHWLTERYCLYTARADGRLLSGEVHHRPWPLQPAELELAENGMASAAGVELAGPPARVRFARRLDVRCWAPRRAGA